MASDDNQYHSTQPLHYKFLFALKSTRSPQMMGEDGIEVAIAAVDHVDAGIGYEPTHCGSDRGRTRQEMPRTIVVGKRRDGLPRKRSRHEALGLRQGAEQALEQIALGIVHELKRRVYVSRKNLFAAPLGDDPESPRAQRLKIIGHVARKGNDPLGRSRIQRQDRAAVLSDRVLKNCDCNPGMPI